MLQADKQRLWRKPTSSANVFVGLAVAATILALVIGGTLVVGRMPQSGGNRDVIALGIVMPMVIMGILYMASMMRTR